mgnify:CR=1 FL=1
MESNKQVIVDNYVDSVENTQNAVEKGFLTVENNTKYMYNYVDTPVSC